MTIAHGGDGKGKSRPTLSLSLDLDNLWSYLKTRGDSRWETLPSYLDTLSDIVLDSLRRHGLKITLFVVGQDAALERNHAALRKMAADGHEIGNHSFHHEPWLHQYTALEIERELASAEEAIETATGECPKGFRGPGFSLSREVVRTLVRRGYHYDATTFPTFLGPLARAYYFRRSRGLAAADLEKRGKLFGTFRDGLRPLSPYRWQTPTGELLEIPVTTMPGLRTPFHLSYILYLASHSRLLAFSYLKLALTACKAARVEPSFLLHPLDFLGGDRVKELGFFPGMNLDTSVKLEIFDRVVSILTSRFEVTTMAEHAKRIRASGKDRLVAFDEMGLS